MRLSLFLLVAAVGWFNALRAAESTLPDLSSVPADLVVPVATTATPRAAVRSI